MKIWVSMLSIIMYSIVLTGCWDNAELPEFGYVQAVAIDQKKTGEIVLTTHFYLPSGGGDMGGIGGQSSKGFDITTTADTTFEAVRDIPIHLGRKAKWDHTRIILIGESFARKQNIGEILDFFFRDHEPRATILTAIVKGEASRAFDIKPFIENTVGQQLREINEVTNRYAGKTPLAPLLDLAIQMKSETAVAILPYISINKTGKQLSVGGTAVIQNGRMTGQAVSPSDTEMLLMITNQYNSGTLEFPCSESEESRKEKESFEVITLDTKLVPKIKNNEVAVLVSTKMKGSVSELKCSTITTAEKGRQLEERIGNHIKKEMKRTIERFQKREMDAYGIGNNIYRKYPNTWKQWKPDWGKRFAEARFDVKVEVTIINSIMKTGTPFGKKED